MGVVRTNQMVAKTIIANAPILTTLFLIKKRKPLMYLLVIALKLLLNPAKNFSLKPFSFPSVSPVWLLFKNRAANAGLNVNALTADMIIAVAMVKANCL
ncbi:hypothetical protein D3C86_1054650 [compost metagenome]